MKQFIKTAAQCLAVPLYLFGVLFYFVDQPWTHGWLIGIIVVLLLARVFGSTYNPWIKKKISQVLRSESKNIKIKVLYSSLFLGLGLLTIFASFILAIELYKTNSSVVQILVFGLVYKSLSLIGFKHVEIPNQDLFRVKYYYQRIQSIVSFILALCIAVYTQWAILGVVMELVLSFSIVIVLRLISKKSWLKTHAIIPMGLEKDNIVSYSVWEGGSKTSIPLIYKGWYSDSRLLTYACMENSYSHLHLIKIDGGVISKYYNPEWNMIHIEISDSDLQAMDSKLLNSCPLCDFFTDE
jgi:hypothetical protein